MIAVIQRFIPIFLFVFSSQVSFGTHMVNYELFYRHISDSTYEITAIFRKSCPSLEGTMFRVDIKSKSLNVNQNILLYYLPQYGLGIPPLIPNDLYNCLDTIPICFEEYYLRNNFTFPGRADDWIISSEGCCRLATLQENIRNQDGQFVSVGLNNLDFPDTLARNSSPLWHTRRPNFPGHLHDTIVNQAVIPLITNQFNTLDQSVKEYDGDSIHYEFYYPKGRFGDSVTYINGFTFQNPYPSVAPISINPITGVIVTVPGIPTGSGVYAVGVRVEEYRNDSVVINNNLHVVPKMIGFVERELLLFIDSAHHRSDSAHPKEINLISNPLDSTIKVRFHNGVSGDPDSRIICNTISPDGSEFLVVDSSTYIAPFDSTVGKIPVLGAGWNCLGGFTSEIYLKLGQKFGCGEYYLILQKGSDLDVIESECGYPEPEGSSASISIDSTVSVNLGPDREVCIGDTVNEVLLAQTSDSIYSWSTNDSSKQITATSLGTYWVSVHNDFGCSSADTIEIKEKKCKTIFTGGSGHFPFGNEDPDIKTGISNLSSAENVQIFPNPAKDRIFIENKYKSEVKLRVYTQRGEFLYEVHVNAESSAVQNLSLKSGLYIVRVQSDQKIIGNLQLVVY